MEIKIFQNPMCLNVLFCVNREDSPYTDPTVLSNRVLPNPIGVHVWEEELDIIFSPSIQYSSLCKSCTPESLADFLAVWLLLANGYEQIWHPTFERSSKSPLWCHIALFFFPQIQPNIVLDMGCFLRLYSSVEQGSWLKSGWTGL